jgi:hypothetical protein
MLKKKKKKSKLTKNDVCTHSFSAVPLSHFWLAQFSFERFAEMEKIGVLIFYTEIIVCHN